MLTEYTTPGASVEVRDDESIYSLLTERIKRTGEDTVIAERKTAPGQWTKVTTVRHRQGGCRHPLLHHPLRVGRA